MQELAKYLGQYRHNDSDEFVFGYDKEGVECLFSAMQEEHGRLLFANRYNADMYRQIDDERKRLQAEVERLQYLLLEYFKEWQIDSGEWDEIEWLERVQVALFGKTEAKEVQP